MRDIPLFTTDFGVAALTLSEVPYKAEAYIRILDASEPRKLLQECCHFCKAVGAKNIYATGHGILDEYPFYTAIWNMRRSREGLEDTDAALFPVLEHNLESWREIYNAGMRNVPNAATMTTAKTGEFLSQGNAYFIHRDRQLLGIGVASGERIEAIVSVVKGSGETLMLALNHALSGDYIEVEVASENRPAVKLYERLGFVKTAEISRWYKICSV